MQRGQFRNEWPDRNPPDIRWVLVLKVGKQFDLSIQEFLLRHHGVDDVFNLRTGVTCFLCARVRCHDLHVKLESHRQIASRIMCNVRCRILPTSLRKLRGVFISVAPSEERAKKKPTWRNTRRCSTTSAYSSTSPPAEPGCSLSSHPTTSTQPLRRAAFKFTAATLRRHQYYTASNGERKRILQLVGKM